MQFLVQKAMQLITSHKRGFLNSIVIMEMIVRFFILVHCFINISVVAYYECMQAISLNDLSDTIYTECSVLEVGSCE